MNMLSLVMTVLIGAGSAGELAHDERVRRFCWELMQQTRYGFSETEEAAFVVVERNGRLSFVRWSSAEVSHQARWRGAFPKGTVAIVHTHPNWIPKPSDIDARTARRSKVPVYVVTRHRITKTTGDEPAIVVKGDWNPSSDRPTR